MCVRVTGGELSHESNPSVTFHRPNGTLRVLALWQGGGVYVSSGGEATLIDSNVYQNEARYVRLLSEPSRTFLPYRPAGALRVLMAGRMAGDSTLPRARQR